MPASAWKFIIGYGALLYPVLALGDVVFPQAIFPHILGYTTYRSPTTSLQIPFVVEGRPIAEVSLDEFKVTSSNTNLFSTAGILLQKTSSNFVLQAIASPCSSGSTILSVILTTPEKVVTNGFYVTIVELLGLPYAIGVPDTVSGFENSPLVIPFRILIHDPCVAPYLYLRVTSSQKSLFTDTNFTFPEPAVYPTTLTLNPNANQMGTSIVNFTLSDGTNSVSSGMAVTILPFNSRSPAVSPLANQNADPGGVLTIPFTVFDPDNTPAEVAVRAYSSNTNIVADADLRISHDGTNYLLRVQTQINVIGKTEITVQANDSWDDVGVQRFIVSSGDNANTIPVLTPLFSINHRFQLNVKGKPGATAGIDESLDLIHWQSKTNLTLDSNGNGTTWQEPTQDRQDRIIYRVHVTTITNRSRR